MLCNPCPPGSPPSARSIRRTNDSSHGIAEQEPDHVDDLTDPAPSDILRELHHRGIDPQVRGNLVWRSHSAEYAPCMQHGRRNVSPIEGFNTAVSSKTA